MSTEHTPEPWKTSIQFDYAFRVEHNETTPVFIYSEKCGLRAIARLGWFGMTTSEFIANARLIAAAPELLEALKSLPLEHFGEDMSKCDAADFVDHAGEFFTAMLKARAVIAKAEGKVL